MEKLDWQGFLDRLVKICKLDGVLTKFTHLATDYERIKFCSEHKLISTKLSEWFHLNPTDNPNKDTKKATNFKNLGNRAYVTKDDNKALDCYNNGLLFATMDDLALLYSNRSAVLFSMELYHECLVDIELALENNFPQDKQYRLYKRKGEAEIKLKRFDAAKTSLEKALVLLDNTAIGDDQDKRRVGIEKLLQSVPLNESSTENLKSLNVSEDVTADCLHNTATSVGVNPYTGYSDMLTRGSKALELCYDEKRGRHLKATTDIPAGSIMISEKPYAAVLLPPWYKTHCQHCFTKVAIVFSCTQCTEVCYCSVRCQQESWQSYHSVECGKLNLMEKIGIAHLALRIVLVTTPQIILRMIDQSEKCSDVIVGCDQDGVYRTDYTSVYHLLPHSENLQPEDLFQYTIAGLLLHLVLKESGFYVKYSDSLRLGSVLVRHVQQLVCNAHAVTALNPVGFNADTTCAEQTHPPDPVSTNTNIVEQNQVRIATAIYPTTSLLNHSCEPTILNSFHRDELIVKVIKDVEKGEEIFNCYGPHYRRMDFKERQQVLQQQYFFTCQCQYCLKGASIEKELNCFICKHCKAPIDTEAVSQCTSCNEDIDFVSHYERPYKESQALFDGGLQASLKTQSRDSIRKALNLFKKALKIQVEILSGKHSMLAKTYDAIAKCHVVLHEYKAAVENLTCSVRIVEIQYGSTSIEVTNELLKLSDVYMELIQQFIDQKDYDGIRGVLPDALKVTEKGMKLIEFNKEPGNNDLLDMKQKHAALTQLRFMPVL